MIKKAVIIKKATALVSDYLSKGWIFNPEPMRGSDGSIFRVSLTDGDETIMVKVDRDRETIEYADGRTTHATTWNLMVLKFETGFELQTGIVLWDKDGETEYEEVFYELDTLGDVVFTKEEFIEARAVSAARFQTRLDQRRRECRNDRRDITSSSVKYAAMAILSKRAGYKRLKYDMVHKVYKCDGYYEVILSTTPSKQAVLNNTILLSN